MKNIAGLIILASVLFHYLMSCNTGARDTVSESLSIDIYDEENLLKLSLEDAEKYHGDICPCLVMGFRTIQLAIRELWKDTIPERNYLKLISKYPGYGLQDAFEYITR